MELWIGREILGKCLSGSAATRVTAPERLPLVLSLSQAGQVSEAFCRSTRLLILTTSSWHPSVQPL